MLTRTQLLHKGVRLAGEDVWQALGQALEALGVRLPGGGAVPDKLLWQGALRDVRDGRLVPGSVHRFRAALRAGMHRVHSTRNERGTKNNSRFVALVVLPRRGRVPDAPQEHISEVLLPPRELAGGF